MRKATADALTRAILHGDPASRTLTVRGHDAYGNPVEEIVDPSKSLADLIEAKTGHRPAVKVIKL